MTDPLLEIQFRGGIDEATREEVLEPGASFTTLENGRYAKVGGYDKRPGFAQQSRFRKDGSQRTSARRAFMNADQVCVIDSTPELDIYSTSLGRSVLSTRVPEATTRLRETPSPGVFSPTSVSGRTQGDCVTVAGGAGGTYAVLAHISKDAAGATFANVSVIDADNGAVVSRPTSLQTGTHVTVATCSTFVFAFVADGTSIYLYRFAFTDASTIATGWVQVGGAIATDFGSAVGGFQAVRLPNGTGVAIAYENNSGGANPISVLRTDTNGPSVTTTLPATAAQLTLVALSEGGTVLWLAYNQIAAIKALSLNETTLAVVATSATVMTATTPNSLFVAPRASGAAAVYVSGSAGSYMIAIQNTAGAAASAGSMAVFGNVRFLSRPFLRGTRIYGHVCSTLLTEMILADVTPDTTGGLSLITYLRPVAVPIQRELFNASGYRTALIPSTDRYLHSFSMRRSGSTEGAALAEYDFADVSRWRPAALNASTWLGGGVLSIFDGLRVFEAAFLVRPEPPTITSTATAGAVTLTTGRLYVLTFEDLDADGNWHISGVSNPSASTGAITAKRIDLEFGGLSITARAVSSATYADAGTGLRIGIWATLDGGIIYYRVAEVANDPNDTAIVYHDDTPDATLASQPLLYGTGVLPGTNGSSQDHRAPPGLKHIVAYNGMLVGANGSTLFFSSQPIDGEGQWFSPVFSVALDEEITGLTVQDGSILVFSRRSIWAVSGEPPSDNATSGGLATPRRLAVDVGCSNASSIVTTGIGTFFQSERGLELLTRGHTVTPIGDKIQVTLAAYPIVTSAVLDTRNGLVRFSLAETVTSGVVGTNGVDVIFDLTRGSWVSRDIRRGSVPEEAAQDALMAYLEGAWRYTWVATNGYLYYERDADDASAHLDASAWVVKKATTPWIHLSGIHGEHFVDQVLVLGKRITDHDLTISIAYDYSDSYTSTKTFTAAQIGALAREWLVKEIAQTTSNAIRVELVDDSPTSGTVGTGAGGTWLAVTVNGAQHRGPKRTTAAQRGGS